MASDSEKKTEKENKEKKDTVVDKTVQKSYEKEIKKEEPKSKEVKKTEKKSPDAPESKKKKQKVSKIEKKPEKVAVDNGEVTKILVEHDNEITDVIEDLDQVKSKRVVVSIPDGSDLLVSSVGMRLIAKYGDEKEKLVTVVTDDKAGQNMARLAGLGVAGAMSDVDEHVWVDAENSRRIREDEASGEVVKSVGEAKEEKSGEGDLVNKDFQDNIEDSEKKAEAKEDVIPVVGDFEESEPVEPMDLGRPRDEGESDSGELAGKAAAVGAVGVATAASVRTVKSGGFEMTIDEGAGAVSGAGVAGLGSTAGTATAMGVEKPVGKVAPVPKSSKKDTAGLIGRDFSSYETSVKKQADSSDVIPTKEGKGGESMLTSSRATAAAVLGNIPLIGGLFGGKKSGSKKNLKKFIIPLVVILIIALVFGYWFFAEAVVEIKVESIPVEYEGEVMALTSAEEVDTEKAIIVARSEVETNNGSAGGAASGLAVRGETASGAVTIYNKTEEDITVAAGTVLSNGGLGFVLQGEVVVPQRPDPIGMGSAAGDVIAQDVGEEFNLESGTTFSVGALALSELSATNSGDFSGGSKEEYSVVSQGDIDTVAEGLKGGLFDASRKELKKKHEGTKWVYVGESVKDELDGEVSSDVPAGAEQATVNVDVNTKSTALYYDSDDLDELVKDLLMKDVDEGDLEGVELSDTMETEVVVKSASVDEGKVVLNVKVSGYVMPTLDEDEIERELYGKSWGEALGYLKQLDYASGDPKMTFYPGWFPRFLWRMPSRNGKITVNVKNIVPEEETVDETGGEEGGGEAEGGE